MLLDGFAPRGRQGASERLAFMPDGEIRSSVERRRAVSGSELRVTKILLGKLGET